MRFKLSLFDRKTDNLPKPAERTWAELCERFANPQVRAAKDGPLFSPATFDPAKREKKNVVELSLLVVDYDHNASFFADLEPWNELGIAFGAYTTHSHR
ncbi:MAG TPA: hypothetical protein VEF04_01670 [Blastocatellia bacterium]|nr:hypothetical protein [Blastocatellia bacterium]